MVIFEPRKETPPRSTTTICCANESAPTATEAAPPGPRDARSLADDGWMWALVAVWWCLRLEVAVAQAKTALAEFVATLNNDGLLRDTVLILTGDQAMRRTPGSVALVGERSDRVFDDLMLLIRGLRLKPGTATSGGSQVDLAPTPHKTTA